MWLDVLLELLGAAFGFGSQRDRGAIRQPGSDRPLDLSGKGAKIVMSPRPTNKAAPESK